VHLRVRGVTVLDWPLVRLDAAALALARAASAGHRAGGGALFPTPGADAGADFDVTPAGNAVALSGFRGCAVTAEASFTVPWAALAGAAIKLGSMAVRRTAPGSPGREELRALLKPIRARHRALVKRPRERSA